MCSRFEVNVQPRDLARRFGFDDIPTGYSCGEIRPTNPVLAVGQGGSKVLPWGLKVDWDPKPLINARCETLTQKVTFRPLLENRCIVPATAYFEWRRVGKARLKNRIAEANGEIFSFAGLHDGQRLVIVTCHPASDIAHIHNRMPIILTRAAEKTWTDENLSFDSVQKVLRPTELGYLIANEEQPTQPDLFG